MDPIKLELSSAISRHCGFGRRPLLTARDERRSDALGLGRIHGGEDRRGLRLFHPAENVEHRRGIELLEDARSLARLHGLVDLDQALEPLVTLLRLLVELTADLFLHGLKLRELLV